jgi:SAM-dependent methyltransferase
MVWLFLMKNTSVLESPIKALHFAPEYCLYEKFKSLKEVEYVPADLGIGYPKGTYKIDITKITFPDNYFDLIICNHVLEHVLDDRSAMKELYRVLSENGYCLVTLPIKENQEFTFEDPSITSASERKKHFGQWDHVRWYGMDVMERLANAGFSVMNSKYGLTFPLEDQRKFGLNEEILIVLRKSI